MNKRPKTVDETQEELGRAFADWRQAINYSNPQQHDIDAAKKALQVIKRSAEDLLVAR